MRYMYMCTCTHARYYNTHNAHARAPQIDGIPGYGQATPSATYFSCMLSSQASCVIVSGLRAALDLDTYPLSNLIRPRCAERAKPGRGKPVLIMHIIWLFRLFSRHISRTQWFQQNRHIIFLALVALKLLVSLMSRLVAACSARIIADKPTDRHTERLL